MRGEDDRKRGFYSWSDLWETVVDFSVLVAAMSVAVGMIFLAIIGMMKTYELLFG